MTTNVLSVQISAEQAAEVDRVLEELNSKLGPMIELSVESRKRLVKMGRKNVDFVARGYRHAGINPEYLTGKLPLEEFKKDMELATWMRTVEKKLGLIANKIKDTAITAEAEAYQSARLYYNAAKAAAAAGDEVAEKIARDMSVHYRKTKKAEDDTTPTPPADTSKTADASKK
jgi:hypothetical protein